MRAVLAIVAATTLSLSVSCHSRPAPPPEAPPTDIEIGTNYHLTSEGPGGRTILTYDQTGQIETGGQLDASGHISGAPVTRNPGCRDDHIQCTYDGEDAVPIAFATRPEVISRFYKTRNLEADSRADGDCADVEIRRLGQLLKRYRYCQLQGVMAVEVYPAGGLARSLSLLDNCGIGASRDCETMVPPVPLILPDD